MKKNQITSDFVKILINFGKSGRGPQGCWSRAEAHASREEREGTGLVHPGLTQASRGLTAAF